MNPKTRWINIFIRDILLALVIAYVNYSTGFRSWWAAFTMGAMVVLISWHFSDLLESRRRL